MFEYTALVDAPVRRFTGIVTGSDADDEPLTVANATRATPPEMPVAANSTLLVATAAAIEPADQLELSQQHDRPGPPELIERSEPAEQFEPTERLEPADGPSPSAMPAPRPAPTAPLLPASRPLPAPSLMSEPRPLPAPSLRPALLAIAAAGITALWWLRREPHDQ